MTTYVIVDGDGLVIEAGRAAVPPSGSVLVDDDWSLEDLSASRISNGQIVLRPQSPEAVHTGTTCSVGPCPAGTLIEVFDYLSNEKVGEGVVSDEGATEMISFQDSGAYRVVVTSPVPHIPTEALLLI